MRKYRLSLNFDRVRARVTSIAKAISEQLGVNVALNQEGNNSTDTVSNINIADPEYYARMYPEANESELVDLCMYSAVHEAGHILHTDVYDRVKDPQRALKYIVKTKPNVNIHKAFSLLNCLEDYRMMRQLGQHRSVLPLMQRSDAFVAEYNIRYMTDNDIKIDYIKLLVFKLYSPQLLKCVPVELNKDKIARMDRLVDDINKIDFPNSTTLDVAKLVCKYYTLFYATEKREENPPTPSSPQPNSGGGDTDDSETPRTGDTPIDGTSDDSDSSSDDSSETKPKQTPQQTSTEKAIEDAITRAVENGESESACVEMTKSTLRKKDLNNIKNKKSEASMFNTTDFGDDAGIINMPTDIVVTRYKDRDPKAHMEINGTPIHRNCPTLWIESKNKKTKLESGNHRKYYAIYNARREGKKLASKLENDVKFETDEFVTKHTSGVLDHKMLVNSPVSSALFKKRQNQTEGNLCVYLLLDASGSMAGTGSSEAIHSAVVLHTALDRLNINHKILAFWSRSAIGRQTINDTRQSLNCNHLSTIASPGYIDVDMYGGFGYNRDGLAIRITHHELMQEPEDNKVLLVLSDGMPNDDDYRSSSYDRKEAGYIDTISAIKHAKKTCSVTGMYLNYKGRSNDPNTKNLIKSMYGNDYSTVYDEKDIERAVYTSIKRALKNIN